MALDHVQFTLPPGREDDADRFYIGVLGFEAEDKPAALAARGGRWYRRGRVRFHLGADAGFSPAVRAHPAFGVAGIDDLVAALEAAGSPVEWDALVPGTRRCYVHDPFGNRLELVEVTEER